jgi:cytochrome oxidase Cu insertion factor (SCO1/SenC/PrrC family)
MEANQPSKKKKIITNIILLFMLIIFPAMSWYYLDRGADFYRGVMNELGDYGTMPEFDLKNSNGDVITQEKFDKKLTLMNFSSPQQDKIGFQSMKYVYEQFDDNKDVLFASVTIGEIDSVSFGSQILEQGISPDKWSFLFGDSATIENLKTKHFAMSDSLVNVIGNIDRALVLVDTNNIIRNFYHSDDTIQIKRLITTMSLLMPRAEKASIKFDREEEK